MAEFLYTQTQINRPSHATSSFLFLNLLSHCSHYKMNLNILRSISARKKSAISGSVSNYDSVQRLTMAALISRVRCSSCELGGGSARHLLFDHPSRSIFSTNDPNLKGLFASYKIEEEPLSTIILEPDMIGVCFCGGIIGTKGTICICPCSSCDVISHKKKSTMSPLTLFITCLSIADAEKNQRHDLILVN